jgi:hypothetical protein
MQKMEPRCGLRSEIGSGRIPRKRRRGRTQQAAIAPEALQRHLEVRPIKACTLARHENARRAATDAAMAWNRSRLRRLGVYVIQPGIVVMTAFAVGKRFGFCAGLPRRARTLAGTVEETVAKKHDANEAGNNCFHGIWKTARPV